VFVEARDVVSLLTGLISVSRKDAKAQSVVLSLWILIKFLVKVVICLDWRSSAFICVPNVLKKTYPISLFQYLNSNESE
jgi:hypothetical protein